MDPVATCTEDVTTEPLSHRAFLFSTPRTASNLFSKMLNLHDRTNLATIPPANGVPGGGGFFIKPMDFYDDNFGLGVSFNEISDSDKKAIGRKFQDATDALANVVHAGAAEGKVAFVKEHIFNMVKPELQAEIVHGIQSNMISAPWTVSIDGYKPAVSLSNPLILPDDFLLTFMPTILIRHPAIAFPSEYRAEVVARVVHNMTMNDHYSNLVLRYSHVRQLYDFFRAQFINTNKAGSDQWPFVIDASDLIMNPEPYMRRFCALTGIDSKPLQYTWAPLDKAQVNSIGDQAVCRFLDTLNASSMIQKEKAHKTVEIDVEIAKFTSEFGQDIGRKMDKWIRDSIPDYEHLKTKCWIPE